MIVTCHSCQTRFRVADEKIGPKGARVRCSRCKTVFAIRAPATVPPAAPEPLPADDPFARAAAAGRQEPAAPAAPAPEPTQERTIPDLALEETQRVPALVRPDPEPTVASRDPGLLDFGDVDLSGPDPFGEARREAFASPPWPQTAPRTVDGEDPLAGLSLGDLDSSEPQGGAARLPSPVDAPPLVAAAPPQPDPPPQPQAPIAQSAPKPPATDPEADAVADAEHSRKRLRAVGFNALSLVALVALAVVLFQVWRGRQVRVVPTGFGPAVAVGISSAPYVTSSGKTVVVVRGQVRASEPLRRIVVRADLLDGGRAVASGTAVAGAVPSVEEIYAAGDPAASEALAASLGARAPARIAPGDTLPFAAVVADAPANLRNVDVRVVLQPER